MDHRDHVALLEAAVEPGSTWADIGAGTGAFTLALAELLGPGGRIVAVDRDRGALATNLEALGSRFPDVAAQGIVADFRDPLDLPILDGIVAANSLHFVPRAEQAGVIRRLAASLRPRGRFVVVEYDADDGNPWVPHPFSQATWPKLAMAAGLVEPGPLRRVPSRLLSAIYAATARRP